MATYSSLEYILICKGLRWLLLRRKTSDGQSFDCMTTKKVETKPSEIQTVGMFHSIYGEITVLHNTMCHFRTGLFPAI